jgi:exonuclease III
LVLGSFNSRSAVNKAANIHDIISENNIDVLALQETWVTSDAPPAIKDDIAPPGFLIQHVHRPTRSGGLAIIHREHLKFRPIDLKWVPTTFEVQILQFHLANPLIIANIYQPSSPRRLYFSRN